MNIEFRFPSDLPYAYVNATGTPEELARMDVQAIAALYAHSMVAFRRAEQEALEAISQGDIPAGVEGYGEFIPAPKEDPTAPREDVDKAVDIIKNALGASEVKAPYDGPAPKAEPKPWEKKKKATKVDLDDFGF